MVPGPVEFESVDLSSLGPPPNSDSQEKKEIPLLEKPSKAAGMYSNRFSVQSLKRNRPGTIICYF